MHYTNTVTERLEGYARKRGHTINVVVSPQNASGRYFVTGDAEGLLHPWLSLGWTQAEARETIISRWK